MRSLFSIPGTNYSSRRGQNSGESVLLERELSMRLVGNEFIGLKGEEFLNSEDWRVP